VKYTQTNQGGSVVSFLVVGVVFVAIVTGAVYALQHRAADNNARTPASPTATKTGSPSSAAPSQSTPNKSAAPAPSSTPAPANPRGNQQPNGATTPAPGTSSPTMPATGPSDMLPGGVAMAVLTGALVAFAQSVQARRRLSL
jgi:hypothetical protein